MNGEYIFDGFGWSRVSDYAPLAEVCSDCGTFIATEEHDSECMIAWAEDMRIIGEREGYVYTDDTTDMGDRGGAS